VDPDRSQLERQIPADGQRRVRRLDLAEQHRQRGVARLCGRRHRRRHLGAAAGAPAFISNPDVLLDYGYRAVNATGEKSKAIISMLMGRAPSYSYFVGCSDGGREALQEAQRFPNDFDGIIVGSPVNDQVGEFGSSYLYNMQATLGGPQTNGVPDAYIPSSKLALLSNAALAQCAGKDGGVASDLFLSDPRQCRFDPEVVQCRHGQDPATCLTSAQVDAARKLYAGPHEHGILSVPRSRARRRGGSRGLGQLDHGRLTSSPGAQYTLGKGFACDLMQNVADCDYLSVDVVQQDDEARHPVPAHHQLRQSGSAAVQGARRQDDPVRRLGGRCDSPENGLNYYRKVTHTIGDPSDFYRVFMVPGMRIAAAGPALTRSATAHQRARDRCGARSGEGTRALGRAGHRAAADRRDALREQRGVAGRGVPAATLPLSRARRVRRIG
jgi:feruloyl esterase